MHHPRMLKTHLDIWRNNQCFWTCLAFGRTLTSVLSIMGCIVTCLRTICDVLLNIWELSNIWQTIPECSNILCKWLTNCLRVCVTLDPSSQNVWTQTVMFGHLGQMLKSAELPKLERVRRPWIIHPYHHSSPFTIHQSPFTFISILSQLASSQPAARMPATFKSSSFGGLQPAKIE